MAKCAGFALTLVMVLFASGVAHQLERGSMELLVASAYEMPEPMFTEETMPDVSPTMYCVLNFSVMYFSLYTILTGIRTINSFTGGGFLGFQKVIETGCTTVTYAPMLCVLFLGTRMRAIQLTQGNTEKYGLPQWWVQWAMYSTLFSVFTQVILVVVISLVTGDASITVDEDGNAKTSGAGQGGVLAACLTFMRYVLMIMLYGGFTVVIVGVFMMKGPEEIWGDKQPPVSPAVWNTILLTTIFFAVYLGVAVTKSCQELLGSSNFLGKLQGSFTFAKYTVNMAPMLCILFIGARMRALQIDPKNGNPQFWAQCCFYACTTSILVQVVLVIVFPFCIDCTPKVGACEGDIVFETKNQGASALLQAIRYSALLALYGGSAAVVVSVFLIEHPTDVALTPPISPAMQCVMNLTVQYFSVYLGLFICVTLKQFLPDRDCLSVCIGIFQAGAQTVMFAPMLCMLFIGCRMRALQLAKAQDGTVPPSAGPPGWAQDGMMLATWSVLVQVIMALVVSLLTGGGTPQMDDDGMLKKPEGGSMVLGIILDLVRYLSLIAMYGGVVIVMVAVFTMTPETLPPYVDRGSLIPGAEVPQPPSPPTPGFLF